MNIKNYMEDLVWQSMEDVLAMYPDFCQCPQCRYDIAALALNALPARYVVTQQGETYTKIHSLEQQFNTDILTAVMKAIVIVSEHPHHTIKETVHA